MDSWLILDKVTIAYAQRKVVHDCSFVVKRGEILSLLGPSGCGKSTILKAIAGLLPVTSGTISLNGKVMSEVEMLVPPQARQVGMIFQDYALFPHLTVAENVAFGLRDVDKRNRQMKVSEMLEIVRLSGYEDRYPHALSGGQQQRVAIARAMVREPHLLLLDEPFSNLDNEVRQQLMMEMKQLFVRQQMTAVFVTHNKVEAFALADQVAVMGDGVIAQMAAPRDLYDHPSNAEIAAFLGHGTVVRFQKATEWWQCGAGRIAANQRDKLMIQHEDDQVVDILLRPHQLVLSPDEDNGNAMIKSARFLGDFTLYQVALPEQTVEVMCKNRLLAGDRALLRVCL